MASVDNLFENKFLAGGVYETWFALAIHLEGSPFGGEGLPFYCQARVDRKFRRVPAVPRAMLLEMRSARNVEQFKQIFRGVAGGAVTPSLRKFWVGSKFSVVPYVLKQKF